MLAISHDGQLIEINPDALITIARASPELYEKLATEDLKLDYDGVRLFIHSPSTMQHEDIVFEITQQVKDFLTENPAVGKATGSHFSIEYPDGKKTEPDLAVIPRKASSLKESVFHGIPLLIVEVLSPSTREHDLTNKKSWAMDNHVPEIWFVDPETCDIRCLVLSTEAGTYSEIIITKGELKSQSLPGFSLDISRLFRQDYP